MENQERTDKYYADLTITMLNKASSNLNDAVGYAISASLPYAFIIMALRKVIKRVEVIVRNIQDVCISQNPNLE